MLLAVSHQDPHSRLDKREFPEIVTADHFGDTAQLARRLKHHPHSELAEELLESGMLELKDIKFGSPNHRISKVREFLCRQTEAALKNFQEDIQAHSKQFLTTACCLAGSEIIPISAEEIQKRFRRLSFHIIDPFSEDSDEPIYYDRSFASSFPLPLSNSHISYDDFAHEALHGISGRAVLMYRKSENPKKVEYMVHRTGLEFGIMKDGKAVPRFQWLGEGLIEHLLKFFCNNSEIEADYDGETSIIKAFIDPKGYYRIPLKLLTAANFANYEPSNPGGFRFPEWYDLTRAVPAKQLLKIEAAIERHDVEVVAEIIARHNIFRMSPKKIDSHVEEY